MYTSFARMTSSPLVFWFTVAMLVAVPVAMLIIGIRGVRKEVQPSAGASFFFLAYSPRKRMSSPLLRRV